MAGKKRVAENASAIDNEAEGAASAPKATKSKSRAAKQPVTKLETKPLPKTRGQKADEQAATDKVVTEPAAVLVEPTANGKDEAKKRARKGKGEVTAKSVIKLAEPVEQEKNADADDAAPELPKSDVKQPNGRVRKAKATEPKVDSSKIQEKKASHAKSKPETAAVSNDAAKAKATKPKRGAKKGDEHLDNVAKEESVAKEPVKRTRKPKVNEVPTEETVPASALAPALAPKEVPKKQARKGKEAKAETIAQEEVEEKAMETGDSPSATVPAKPAKDGPKKRTPKARKAKA